MSDSKFNLNVESSSVPLFTIANENANFIESKATPVAPEAKFLESSMPKVAPAAAAFTDASMTIMENSTGYFPNKLFLDQEPSAKPFFSSTIIHGVLIFLAGMIELPKVINKPIEIELVTPTVKIQPKMLRMASNKAPSADNSPAPKAIKEKLSKVESIKPATIQKLPEFDTNDLNEVFNHPHPTVAGADTSLDTSDAENFLAESKLAESEASLDSKELDSGFEKVQKESKESLSKVRREMSSNLDSFAKDSDVSALESKRKNAKELAALNASDKNRRKSELSGDLAKNAKDRAEAERAATAAAAAKSAAEAKAKAARIAAAKAAATARAGAASTQAGIASSRATGAADSGANQDGQGSSSAVSNAAGSGTGFPGAGEIRQIGDLRQMPGNHRPTYNTEERLARMEGTVVFIAYVSNSGTLSNIKKSVSSGFASLDTKALASIRTWRFYPGQEGWVEIPFVWSLKGMAKEKPTLLRRK